MRLYVALAALFAAATISSCASMSENECLVADWHALGYEDGAQGRSPSYVAERRQACAHHKVAMDFEDYLAGRERGLVAYCRPERGFNLGAQGGGYAGVCPAALEGPFMAQYDLGRRLFDLSDAARRTHAEVEAAHARLENLSARITDAEVSLVFDDLTIEERAILVVRIAEMKEQRGAVRQSIPHLHRAQAEAAANLESYEAWLEGERGPRMASAGD